MSTSWANWDSIAAYLQVLAAKGSYATFVLPLIDLIPQFRSEPQLQGLQPGLEHLTLTLALSDARRKIHIDFEGQGLFNIYFDHCDDAAFSGKFYGERTITSAVSLVARLGDYVARLREERGVPAT